MNRRSFVAGLGVVPAVNWADAPLIERVLSYCRDCGEQLQMLERTYPPKLTPLRARCRCREHRVIAWREIR